jgi:DNA-binding IclR family transcriptional regulator
VLSLFKLEGQQRSAFELRTGLMSLLSIAAGKVFAACLPLAITKPCLEQEWGAMPDRSTQLKDFHAKVQRELQQNKYATMRRSDIVGYASIAAPVTNWTGDVKFVLSVVGSHTTLNTEPGTPHVQALLEAAGRASVLLGGTSRLWRTRPSNGGTFVMCSGLKDSTPFASVSAPKSAPASLEIRTASTDSGDINGTK